MLANGERLRIANGVDAATLRPVLVKERPSKLTPSNRTRVLVPGWSMRTKLSGVRAAPE